MACLLRFLLVYVFYGVYLGAVSVFGDVVLLFGDTWYSYDFICWFISWIMTHLLLRKNVSLFHRPPSKIPRRQGSRNRQSPCRRSWNLPSKSHDLIKIDAMSAEPIELWRIRMQNVSRNRIGIQNESQKYGNVKTASSESLSPTKMQVLRTRPMSVHFLSACGACASFILTRARDHKDRGEAFQDMPRNQHILEKTNLDMIYHDITIAYRNYIMNHKSITNQLWLINYKCTFDIIWHIHPLIHDKWVMSTTGSQSCGVAAAQRATEGSSALAVFTVLSTVRGEGSIHWPLRHWDKQKRQRVIW